MNSIKNILVPIDFSANSLKALEYATRFAEKTDAKLYVMHAYRLIKPTDYDDPSTGRALKKQLEDSLNLKLKELEFEHLVSHTIDYELMTTIGFAIDNIQNIIVSKAIDLVIMGARGKRELEEIFGSTTWSVIKSTTVPVMAIPNDVNVGNMDHIIMANESPLKSNPNSFELIKHIASSYNTKVVVLKCEEDKNIINQQGDAGPFYQNIFKGLKVVTQFCDRAEFIDGLKKQINQYKGDMLVLMPKENVFLESYFNRENLKEVIVNTKIPLLMIQKPLVDEQI